MSILQVEFAMRRVVFFWTVTFFLACFGAECLDTHLAGHSFKLGGMPFSVCHTVDDASRLSFFSPLFIFLEWRESFTLFVLYHFCFAPSLFYPLPTEMSQQITLLFLTNFPACKFN